MNEFERRLSARQDELDWLYMELSVSYTHLTLPTILLV